MCEWHSPKPVPLWIAIVERLTFFAGVIFLGREL